MASVCDLVGQIRSVMAEALDFPLYDVFAAKVRYWQSFNCGGGGAGGIREGRG
jgi:hypothetical protein